MIYWSNNPGQAVLDPLVKYWSNSPGQAVLDHFHPRLTVSTGARRSGFAADADDAMAWFAAARTGPRSPVEQGVAQPGQKRSVPPPGPRPLIDV